MLPLPRCKLEILIEVLAVGVGAKEVLPCIVVKVNFLFLVIFIQLNSLLQAKGKVNLPLPSPVIQIVAAFPNGPI